MGRNQRGTSCLWKGSIKEEIKEFKYLEYLLTNSDKMKGNIVMRHVVYEQGYLKTILSDGR